MNHSFFQTPEWEQFKLKTGYEKSYRINDVLVLQRNLPFGRSMLYSPMVSKAQIDSVQKEFIAKIREVAKENNAIFYRLELDIPQAQSSKISVLNSQNFAKSFEEMQPENNWVVDISKEEKDILAVMKQKGRYNIRVAEKNNIKVTSSEKIGEELDIFYGLYSKTGKRKKVTFRGKAYFENLLDILGKIGYARVYAAKSKINGKDAPLAAAIVIFYNKEALYLYGGSSDEYKNLMAPYLLHWKIMLDAKKRDVERYDFLGIAPTGDQSHPWAGITRFKKQFGGEQLDIAGSYDMIFKPIEYQMFKMAEKIRRK
ncbi:MAG: peptidoglycan bridge formation glycyltransferase FemA/FemB family protein [Patescibacteria group bacterium]|nr:peptidoglycan bridge formation glycyltransferase FemA/FemB family protein [Patescibacteria group bacterium]